MISHFRRALVLCAHTDDEFGCAGTVLRLTQAGADVRYLALSDCAASVPPGYPRDALRHECAACTAALGVAPEHVEIGPFEVRHFPRDRQAILERLVALQRSFRPDLVLLPASSDTHQDHEVVAREGFRAFKHATVLGYELPQNLVAFHHSAFVALDEATMAAKVAALAHYASQGFRPYSTEAFLRGLGVVRGVQAGAPFAEAFEVVRLLLP